MDRRNGFSITMTRLRLPRLLKKRRSNRVLAAERQGFSIMTTRFRLPRLLEKHQGFSITTTRFRLPRLLKKRRSNRVLAAERQGFSIIELITAVVIIAVMALIAVAVFKNFRETTSVKAAARDVASIMRLARQKAITNREDYYAVYDITNNKVWVQPASTYPPKNPDPGTEHSLPDRAIIDSVTSGGSDPLHKHHTFTPRSTSSSGSVKLKDEKQRLEYSVRLVSTTARARIYDSWP